MQLPLLLPLNRKFFLGKNRRAQRKAGSTNMEGTLNVVHIRHTRRKGHRSQEHQSNFLARCHYNCCLHGNVKRLAVLNGVHLLEQPYIGKPHASSSSRISILTWQIAPSSNTDKRIIWVFFPNQITHFKHKNIIITWTSCGGGRNK